MGAGVDAVEAERAVHIARLPRLEQVQFAAGYSISTTDAVLGSAPRADFRIANLHFQWGNERLHEVKLADWTDIFTKRGAPKETVDDKGCEEVADRNPSGPPGTIPKGKRLIGPKKHDEQDDRQPLAPQPARPTSALREPAPCERTWQHKRTGHAEDIAHREQG